VCANSAFDVRKNVVVVAVEEFEDEAMAGVDVKDVAKGSRTSSTELEHHTVVAVFEILVASSTIDVLMEVVTLDTSRPRHRV
jgi:hypothetical protein